MKWDFIFFLFPEIGTHGGPGGDPTTRVGLRVESACSKSSRVRRGKDRVGGASPRAPDALGGPVSGPKNLKTPVACMQNPPFDI